MKRRWLSFILSILLLAALPFSLNAEPKYLSQSKSSTQSSQTENKSEGDKSGWTPEVIVTLIVALVGPGGLVGAFVKLKEFQTQITQKEQQIQNLQKQLSQKIEVKNLPKEITNIISTEEFQKNLIFNIIQQPRILEAIKNQGHFITQSELEEGKFMLTEDTRKHLLEALIIEFTPENLEHLRLMDREKVMEVVNKSAEDQKEYIIDTFEMITTRRR